MVKNKKTIVVYGGGFNPPTNAHFSLAQQIYEKYGSAEYILFVPVGDQYPKNDLLAAKHRVNMLRAVCNNNEAFRVSTIEVDAKKQPYTIDTLREIKKQNPEHDIWFILGGDNLKQLPSWNKYTELLTEFRLVVFERDGESVEKILTGLPSLECYKDKIIIEKPFFRNECNSTTIRQKISEGKSARYLVPDEVYRYIAKNKLYL